MTTDSFLEKAVKFEIEPYKKIRNLAKTHVPYTGSPRKHPDDSNKIYLLSDPFSTNTGFLEFSLADIEHVEGLSSLVNLDGEAISMVRVWVKKGAVGKRITPFVVEQTNPA